MGKPISPPIEAFGIWQSFLSSNACLEDRDKNEALDRLNKSLKSRLQIYQSDWRLQLLLTLEFAHNFHPYEFLSDVPFCRCVDILLEMDDHDLHLVDRHALDLRHQGTASWNGLMHTISGHVDGVKYASAALHCMRFLSSPPKYFKNYRCPEMSLIYAEWKATCQMTLYFLCILLEQSNASPEFVQFLSNHDIHPAIQKDFLATSVWDVNVRILAFLSRESMIPNWRIISAIQQSFIITRKQRRFDEVGEWSSDEDKDMNLTRRRLLG